MGFPSKNSMFLFGKPFEPDRAGIKQTVLLKILLVQLINIALKIKGDTGV